MFVPKTERIGALAKIFLNRPVELEKFLTGVVISA